MALLLTGGSESDRGIVHHLDVGDAAGLDPMGFPELLDALASWVGQRRAPLERRSLGVVTREHRDADKWCGTVEITASQRLGYLTVWSSGELDCQVIRGQDFYVLNEHRLIQSRGELEHVLTTFFEVVSYADPRDAPLSQ
jgi:hypothetical protein